MVVSELIHKLGGPGAVALWCDSFITGDAVTAWGLRNNIPWKWRSRVKAMAKARGVQLPLAEQEHLSLDLSDLWLEGDDGLGPSDMDGALPRPAKGYVTCPLAWLARVLPQVRTPAQLVVAQVLYRQCLLHRSRTASLPNGELRKLGISRYTKYRALAELEDAGALTIEARNGRSTRATLHWFP